MVAATLLVAVSISTIIVAEFTNPFTAVLEPTLASACPAPLNPLNPTLNLTSLAQQYTAAGINAELGTALILTRPAHAPEVCAALESAFQYAFAQTPRSTESAHPSTGQNHPPLNQ